MRREARPRGRRLSSPSPLVLLSRAPSLPLSIAFGSATPHPPTPRTHQIALALALAPALARSAVAEVENIMLILAEDEHDLHTLQSIAQVRQRASGGAGRGGAARRGAGAATSHHLVPRSLALSCLYLRRA